MEPFTEEQLALIKKMIDQAIKEHDRDLIMQAKRMGRTVLR